MSVRLPSVKTREVIRALEKGGWFIVRQRGSHITLGKAEMALDHDSIKFAHAPEQIFQIHLVEPTLSGLVAACLTSLLCRDTAATFQGERSARSFATLD